MKYLIGYTEYITELRKFVTNSSSSGRTREIDVLYDEPEDVKSSKSPSARVLLRNKLSSEEFADKFEKTPDLINIEDLMRLPTRQRRLIISKSNLGFLRKREEKGELRCEYCDKGPLRIYGLKEQFNKSNGATADHKNPISKGGDIFDNNNLAVCCSKCNSDKSNMSIEDWIGRLKNLIHSKD